MKRYFLQIKLNFCIIEVGEMSVLNTLRFGRSLIRQSRLTSSYSLACSVSQHKKGHRNAKGFDTILLKRNLSSLGGLGSSPVIPSKVGPIGNFLADTGPVLAMQDFLYWIHDIPGMNWAATILVTTVGIRLFISLPIGIIQQKSLATLENLQPQIKSMAEELSRETQLAIKIYKWDEKKAVSSFKLSYKKHWRNLMEEYNCHPMRSIFLVWLQIPVWICFSSALRNVVFVLPFPRTSEMINRFVEMGSENVFWLESLAVVDPFVLPAIFLTANLLNIQLNSLRKLSIPQTTLQKVVPWIFRVAVVGLTVLASYTPAAVSMYWATSSVLALLQNILLKSRFVRKKVGIPTSLSNP